MATRIFVALTLALSTIGLLSAGTPVTFKVTEPISVDGIPPVTLGPGTYLLRKVDRSNGVTAVQVLSQERDYVYTTVLTIPATRLSPGDRHQILFSETSSGNPPALHFWFPSGENVGYEFINTHNLPTPVPAIAPRQLQFRIDKTQNPAAQAQASPAEYFALREALLKIESGKLGAARDCFKRNHFLAQNRDGAFTSLLLALLMTDRQEAIGSLDKLSRLDPERSRVLSRLDIYGVVESLPVSRSNLKESMVRRFLLKLALEMTDDAIARTALLSFERRVLKGDSLPVEMALERRREELDAKRQREEQWVLAVGQLIRLNDCVKSLLNRVGALEYSGSVEATLGLFGPVRLRVVLNQRRLIDLDAIVESSHRAICQRRSTLERLISRRNAAIARELDALRSALRELDREPGSPTKSQFGSLRAWESSPASGVARDLMMLAESATLPYMRPSMVLRTNSGYLQLNIAGSLARLAEWAGL